MTGFDGEGEGKGRVEWGERKRVSKHSSVYRELSGGADHLFAHAEGREREIIDQRVTALTNN